MTSFTRYMLRPKGAFHFGTHGIEAEQSVERCHSDTLYSALLNESLRGGPTFFAPPADHDDGKMLDPPLLLSSCFPYVGGVPLLPLPRMRLPLPDAEGQRKRFKNLTYVSRTLFQLIVENNEAALQAYLPDTNAPPRSPASGGSGRGRLYMGDSIWIADEDGTPLDTKGDALQEPFWKVDTVPHVTVDRFGDSSAFYQVGQVYFGANCGLYLLCQERRSGAAATLFDLLQRLGDSGLGGRRSRGLGQFAVAEDLPLELDIAAADPQRMVLLSRYRPSQHDLDGDVLGQQASYDLARVGGWLQTPAARRAQHRRAVRLINEGSVIQLPRDGSLPIGTVCDVRPVGDDPFPHPVWRYGLALGVAIGGA